MNLRKNDTGIYSCQLETGSFTAATTLNVFQKQDVVGFQIKGYNNPSEKEPCHNTSHHKFQVRFFIYLDKFCFFSAVTNASRKVISSLLLWRNIY